MKIISVIPLKKGILKGDLTYFTSLAVSPGSIVTVPLRNKNTLALVTKAEELAEAKSDVKGMDFNLRKATEDKGKSVFLPEFLGAIFDSSTYFAKNQNDLLVSLIPNIFIEEYDKIADLIPALSFNTESAAIKSSQGNKIRAEKLLLQYPLPDRLSAYKTLVRESFARGKSVFVVLPTEFDIEKFSGELSKGIEQFTFSMHSGISAKKNLKAFENIVTSTHPVLIVGTPPYLSVPRHDIGTIILEHESSSAYRMISRPQIDLRIFTEIYASKINAKLILADDMLRFETGMRQDADNMHPLHPLSYRIDFGGETEIIEKGKKEKGKKFQILEDRTVGEIGLALKNNKSVFIFSLRKGLATMTICRDCNEVLTCATCGAPVVLHTSSQGKKRIFVCNRCETTMDGETLCALCGSWNLMPLGIGTDTVYEEAKKLFPDAKILKLDKESAKTSAGAKTIIKEFKDTNKNKGGVLIGTEMTFFYMKDQVPMSVVASFDSLWSIPNFRMSEKIIQLVLSISGMTTEKLIIQTKNGKDSAIQAIKSGNLLSFVREELEDRKKFGYPPFKRFIKITYLGDKGETGKARKLLEEMFAEYSPEIFSGFVSKLKGTYATNALIKIDPEKWSSVELSNGSIDGNLHAKLLSLPPSFEVSVDPEDLL